MLLLRQSCLGGDGGNKNEEKLCRKTMPLKDSSIAHDHPEQGAAKTIPVVFVSFCGHCIRPCGWLSGAGVRMGLVMGSRGSRNRLLLHSAPHLVTSS